jgi:hypothetical protein
MTSKMFTIVSLSAAFLASLLTVPAANASNAEVESLNPINMEVGSISVPAYGHTPQMFTIGQLSNTKCTIQATWQPSSPSYYGIMQFRSSGSSAYILQIHANQVSLLLKDQSGIKSLKAVPYSFKKTPNQIQLVEDGSTFTVSDMSSDPPTQVLSCTDSTIKSGAYIFLGTNSGGSGQWSMSVTQGQNAQQPALPPLQNAEFFAPSPDQINTSNNYVLVNHFGAPHNNCIIGARLTPMAKVTPGQELGHITCRREAMPGITGTCCYEAHIRTDNVVLIKLEGTGKSTVCGRASFTCKSYPNGLLLSSNSHLPFLLICNANNIQFVLEPPPGSKLPASKIIDYTDTSGTVYTTGYQFGIYTQQFGTNCWDNLSVTPLPGMTPTAMLPQNAGP